LLIPPTTQRRWHKVFVEATFKSLTVYQNEIFCKQVLTHSLFQKKLFMKKQASKKLFAFIVAIMMFSVLPQLTYGQNKNDKHRCPKGYYQFRYTDPWSGARRCYCYLSGSSANGNTNNTSANTSLSITGSDVTAISFQLMGSQKISLKIYDAMGRLVKTFADTKTTQGENKIEWDARDDNGNKVTAGTYLLKLESEDKIETKKIYLSR